MEKSIINYKKWITKQEELSLEIDITSCFMYAKYNNILQQIDAYIGILPVDEGKKFRIIEFSTTDRVNIFITEKKRGYINKHPFKKFAETHVERGFEIIQKEEFMTAWNNIKKNFINT